MHRNRAKLLQGLEGQLSHAHYPGLSRSISLELGNIYREIADIKASAGREPDKVSPFETRNNAVCMVCLNLVLSPTAAGCADLVLFPWCLYDWLGCRCKQDSCTTLSALLGQLQRP